MNPPSLPFDAPLAAYQQQAEELAAALRAGDLDAQWRFKWEHPRFRGRAVEDVRADTTLGLADAQIVVAHTYGFEHWEDVVEFARAIQSDAAVVRFERTVEAIIAGDTTAVQAVLHEHAEIVRARSTRRHGATLLHYLAANGVEGCRQRTPANAVEIARLLLAAGAEPDALAEMYDAQCTPLSMLVSSTPPAEAGLQAALAETLLDYGAQLDGPGTNWQSAVDTALRFGFLATAQTIARRGGELTRLSIAAGLGRLADAERLLPTAESAERHAALALAAQNGHASVVRLLLDAGEDPNRLNPEGYHSHSTPLHQAVWADHGEVVRLLVERGARLDVRDTLYHGTPLGWAEHGGRTGLAEFFRQSIAAGNGVE